MEEDERETEHDEPVVSRSGRVRIIGAELAGGRAAAGGTAEENGAGSPGETGAELPHWTEAPTGQVPAVLSRNAGGDPDDPWASLPEPTWREEHADWAAHEQTFQPAMLADTQGLGALGDQEQGDREPWAFELPASGQVDVVRAGEQEPGFAEDPVGGHTWHAGGDLDEVHVPVDDLPGEKTGVVPAVGRELDDHVERTGSDDAADEGGIAQDEVGSTHDGHDERVDVPLPEPGGEMGARTREEPPERPRRGRGAPSARQVPRRRALVSEQPAAPLADEARRSGRNLPVAIASGVGIGAVVLVLFHFGTVPAMVVATAVVTLAAVEAFAAFRRGGYHPATLLGLAAVVGVMVGTYDKGQEALPLVLVLLVAFTFLWHLFHVDRRADPVRSTAATLLVFGWIGAFGSFGALLLAPSLFPDRHGIAFLLGAIITAVAYDIGALVVGAWVGTHPLSAASPRKTWEGLIGGTVAAIIAAVLIVHLIHPWTIGKAAALGVIVAIVSPIGDLAESQVKRHLGLKDMGRILPGHGGVLDRVDGLLFVLPATFYLVKVFHLG